MANVNVRRRLEQISDELDALVEHVFQYSDIAPKDARFVDNVATGVSEQAARLAGLAREAQGERGGASLPKKVRKALGFTNP
jgi:hypothetical protein